MDSDSEFSSTPPDIADFAKNITLNLLPTKSRGKYEKQYNILNWCRSKKIKKYSENVMLTYFGEKSKTLKSSTLWSQYSMLRSTLQVKNDINISKYTKPIAFLKLEAVGYEAKKSQTFSINKNKNRTRNDEKDIFEDENDDTKKDRHQEKLGYNRINKTYFEEQEKKPKDCYLFSSLRWEYLDKMPPFQIEINSKLYEACIENYPIKEQWSVNEEADIILRKLQALLCSQVVPKQVLTEVNGYLSVNENLRGNVSLQSISMLTNDAILLLIDNCPQCLLQFGKDRFVRTDEWKFLIATVQRRILKLAQNEKLKRVCFFHKKILKDILTYVASNMSLDQLILVFPQRFSTNNQESNQKVTNDLYKPEIVTSDDDTDILKEIQNYEPYVVVCKETMHANQIHKLITTTGQQLLCTLNL